MRVLSQRPALRSARASVPSVRSPRQSTCMRAAAVDKEAGVLSFSCTCRSLIPIFGSSLCGPAPYTMLHGALKVDSLLSSMVHETFLYLSRIHTFPYFQVESLLSSMVHETDIMELNLEIGDFSLKVKRSTAAAPVAAAPVAAPAPLPVAPPPPRPVSMSAAEILASVDETLLPVEAPKVGIFRRGRYAGNKRVGSGNCVNESDKVKKGQPVGYVEQLGTFVPVEAPQAGELVKFDAKEGDAVEYGQTIVHLSPFFGGHIIGDSKHM
eukprot:gene1597-32986_t